MTQQQVLEQNLSSTDVLRMYIGRGHSECTTDEDGSNSLTVSFLRPTQAREKDKPFPVPCDVHSLSAMMSIPTV